MRSQKNGRFKPPAAGIAGFFRVRRAGGESLGEFTLTHRPDPRPSAPAAIGELTLTRRHAQHARKTSGELTHIPHPVQRGRSPEDFGELMLVHHRARHVSLPKGVPPQSDDASCTRLVSPPDTSALPTASALPAVPRRRRAAAQPAQAMARPAQPAALPEQATAPGPRRRRHPAPPVEAEPLRASFSPPREATSARGQSAPPAGTRRRRRPVAASPVPPSAPDRLRAAYRRARTRLAPFMRQATFVTLCLIALFSLMMIMGIVFRSVRTRRLNAELSQRRAQLNQTAEPAVLFTAQPAPSAALSATPAPSSTPVPSRAPAPSPSGRPLASAIPIVKSTAYHRVGGTALPHMEALYADNHDLVGWIEIPEVLDLPVLYRDNSYYLTRDFYKKKNASGSIFLDVNHRFGEHTQNLLLHGHNMKDGTMFGRLVHYYQDLDYFKRNAFVHYDTLWEQQQYVMFAVLRVSLDVQSDHFFDYFSHPSFATDESFEYYVRALQLGSMYAVPIDVEPRDALLTLSTCMGDDRLVIVCRRLREDESRSSLRQQIRLTTWQ